MTQSKDLARAIADLRRFDAALISYLDTLHFWSGSRHDWGVNDGQEDESRRCRQELEEAAGAAQLAVERADRLRDVPVVRSIEPRGWNDVFRDGRPGAVDDLRSTVLQSIGALERERERLRDREKSYFGLASLLARFLALPRTVREVAGVDAGSGWQASAATIMGVIGQILIAAVAAILGAIGWEVLRSALFR